MNNVRYENGGLVPFDDSEYVTRLPINEHLRSLVLELADAEWNADEAKADIYRRKVAECKAAISRGETLWYTVHF